MEDKRLEEMEALEKLCKPVIEYLKEKYHPNCTLEVTTDGIKVKEDILSIPF